MKVELTQLELTNYRNIPYACYKFDGNSKIVGDNRIGKTNTLEAIVWLLTDRLLNGSSDISAIKPIDDTRKEVRVEGTFNVDGRIITLRKEYGEDWVKTRGTDVETLKGHYLTYYYNGVKQKAKKDWYALFNEDFGINVEFRGIDIVQMLTNPFYLGDMGESDGWTDLRAFIIQIIGDVSDEDVYRSQPSTMIIKEELRAAGGRLEQLKRQYSNEVKGLKEQLIGDDANVKMLEETPCPTDDEVAVANKAIEDLNEQIAKLQGDKGNETSIVELEKQILKKRNELLELQSKCTIEDTTSDLTHRLAVLNEEYRGLLIDKTNLMEQKSRASIDFERAKDTIVRCSSIRTDLITKLRELDAEIAGPVDAVCPTCGRPLEGEHLEKFVAERKEYLNAERETLIKQGKENRALLDKASDVLKAKETEQIELRIAALEKDILDKKNEIAAVNDKLNVEKAKPRELVENSQVYACKEAIKLMEGQLHAAKTDLAAANESINSMIRDLTSKKEPYKKVLSDYAYAQHQMETLDTVKEQRKNHALRLASFEQKIELLALFMRVKLELLDEKVKTVFGSIKFQLVSANLKEGSYNPVCKPYIYNVDKDESTAVTWRNGSKSERVITGIAIAEKIKQCLGLADLPFMFDEGGEISTDTFESKFKTNSQLICVKVMDNIKKPIVMKI